ncbi:MAG TPA: tRNA (adenosine(37)-N6)-threonylcarbamoyltransferase complex transferase subunit TsaD [Anaerolineae bacterium]|nr:tRNA (adenosine(37)-N6)-threonylcarbamoyltransferase complex transferase subunit TsaD [Anaerolineae bacterium]HQH37879.1 tRNA (adenosine(37)-N6)-threonylcarbamoyltransferase complex transferase subunit TsaD [Anaerolineae bacterium]
MRVLGIETSCDETAAAVVEDGCTILSNVIASQVDLHAPFGGVFPELASRAHVEAIAPVVEQALRDAHVGWEDMDAIAVTYGPGLPGSLLVGLNFAKGAALGKGLPLVPINHLEAHMYAHWLRTGVEGSASGDELTFPLLTLIVSGGHTELIVMHHHGDYTCLGSTLDDAAGEAFDKVARLLELDYPGGPAIEKVARQGNPRAFDFPRAWLPGTYDFSFSGLKTAVLRTLQRFNGPRPPRFVADIAAAFQAAVVEVLAEKTAQAARTSGAQEVLLSGGVSANASLRAATRARVNVPVYTLPSVLCTDNAAMVAAAGTYRYQAGVRAGWDLDIEPGLRLA